MSDEDVLDLSPDLPPPTNCLACAGASDRHAGWCAKAPENNSRRPEIEPRTEPVVRALDVQEGGSHYKEMAIQPVEYIMANGIGFVEGNVIKYVSRWRAKGGVRDLRKARHCLDLLIEAQQP